MADWVDFDFIKAQVSICQILERNNLLGKMEEKGNQIIGLCPFHDNTHPSFKVTPGKEIWHCFGCNAGGDVIDLVRYFENLTEGKRNADRRKAALLIAEWYGIESKRPEGQPKRISKEEAITPEVLEETEEERVKKEEAAQPINPPLKFELKNIDPTHPYLAERGLTEEIIQTFGVGYFTGKGSMQGRVVIPIHNKQGELLAYAGRWPGEPPEDEPKYKLPPAFRKSHVLYNLHRAKDYVNQLGGLIVTEGFFTVMDLWKRGRRNAVAVMGSSLSEDQVNLVVDSVGLKGQVVLLFDDDEAGKRGMQDAVDRLVSRVFVRVVELPK